MIKKLSVMLLSLSMLLAMSACDGDSTATSSDAASSDPSSAVSEVSSEVSQETSSVEELSNTLTDDEITAIAAEMKKMTEAENHSMTMGIDVAYETAGMEVAMVMEMLSAVKGSGDALEVYSKTHLNMFGMSQDQIAYFKDGKAYTMTVADGEVDGYYEEMTAEEYLSAGETGDGEGSDGNAMADFEGAFSEEELKKAVVTREEGKKIITCDSESDAIQAMSAQLVEEMGYASNADDVVINELGLSFTVSDNNVVDDLTMTIDCNVTMEEEGQTVEMAINMTITMTDIAYGEADDIEITAPEGLEDLPSFEDYLNDMMGEDWSDEDWLDDAV